MQLVLVSACLLGSPVRYNGAHKRSASEVLQRWLEEGRVLSVCPEVAGGAQVLAGVARVLDPQANDVTAGFIAGARHALEQARRHRVRIAVLKEGSPSCGSGTIHDGTFTGTRVPGSGVTAALLESAGVRVFSEEQFAEADRFLVELEARGAA